MESPAHPFEGHEALMREWRAQLASAPIHLYPNPSGCGLQEALRSAFDIPDCAAVALGNGSDELIQFITMLTAKPGAAMLAAEPGFIMYRHNAALYGMDYVGVPLNGDFAPQPARRPRSRQEAPPCPDLYRLPEQPDRRMFHACRNRSRHRSFRRHRRRRRSLRRIQRRQLPAAGGQDSQPDSLTHPQQNRFCRTAYRLCDRLSRSHRRTAKILPPYNMNQLSLTTAKLALQHYGIISANIDSLKTNANGCSPNWAKYAV